MLITGHTGFKGSWLTVLLCELGAKLYGISLNPRQNPNLFDHIDQKDIIESNIIDIRNFDALEAIIKKIKPDVVFHLAAQSLVRYGYDHPYETFSTNTYGTLNLIEILSKSNGVRQCSIVTTDKVYAGEPGKEGFDEDNLLGGEDPYSSSKAQCEAIAHTYGLMNKFQDRGFVTLRAGNVIGGGDWSTDRLIPDLVRAYRDGKPLYIRNKAHIRPWQHVLEPLYQYVKIAEVTYNNDSYNGAYNIGPDANNCKTVEEVIKEANRSINVEIKYEKTLGYVETGVLRLNPSKANTTFNLTAKWGASEAIERSMKWYEGYYEGVDPYLLCTKDIAAYAS